MCISYCVEQGAAICSWIMTRSDDEDAHLSGVRVHVRTRYGWALTGELRKSGDRGIRMFDPEMGDIVRLGDEEVIDIAILGDAKAERSG